MNRPTDITGSPIVMGKWYWARNRTGRIAGTGKFAAIISKPDDITFFINGLEYDPGGFAFALCNPQPEMVFQDTRQDAMCSVCDGAGQCETYPPGHLADSFNGAGDPVSYMDECNNCDGTGVIEPETTEPVEQPTNPAEIQYVPGTWYVYRPQDGQTRTFYKTPRKMTIPYVELREVARDKDGNEIPPASWVGLQNIMIQCSEIDVEEMTKEDISEAISDIRHTASRASLGFDSKVKPTKAEPEPPPVAPDPPLEPRYAVFVLSQSPSGQYYLELLGIQPTQSVANSLAANAVENWGTCTVLPVWTKTK